MEKIYSRARLLIKKPNIKGFNGRNFFNNNSSKHQKIAIKFFKIFFIMLIAIFTMYKMIEAVNGIIEKQCLNQAKSIATQISNQQATEVVSKYKYEDLFKIERDSNRKYFYD